MMNRREYRTTDREHRRDSFKVPETWEPPGGFRRKIDQRVDGGNSESGATANESGQSGEVEENVDVIGGEIPDLLVRATRGDQLDERIQRERKDSKDTSE